MIFYNSDFFLFLCDMIFSSHERGGKSYEKSCSKDHRKGGEKDGSQKRKFNMPVLFLSAKGIQGSEEAQKVLVWKRLQSD